MPGKPVVTIIGSLNVDLVSRTPRMPSAGETITASSFDIGFGGKGANQAVAAARLSRSRDHSNATVDVKMMGVLGDDAFSDGFMESLQKDGLDTSEIRKIEGKTGTAVIIVEEDSGENRILISPGANGTIGPSNAFLEPDSTASTNLKSPVDVAVFQLEIPFEAVKQQIVTARRSGATVILNPAPAVPLPGEMLADVDHLIMNESEAAILSGYEKEVKSDEDLNTVAAFFLDKKVEVVIITLGGEGCFYHTTQRVTNGQKDGVRIPPRKTKVVDTTAAGDTFVGAYAVMVAEFALERRIELAKEHGEKETPQQLIEEAIRFAVRASSRTVEKEGAQSSIPWLDEVPE
ncbi:ribokinase [Aulographum hederae CBS 113979]|uniref:Ribokinase n=1 Tax=Aulographum hederae CBS 113979 TaxID=1176131 RepID=A0A6G1GLB0_9PEZI|nr:ribokinase [Aulographum hederae CBS 113979]